MGSGDTTSNPTIPDEFRPFVTGTMGQWMGQQAANPIGAYNGNNAMDVEGMTPLQQLAMGYSAGNLQNSPQDLLAMQAAQRAAGMAGSGPTTGQYNPQGEMGLQDWAQLMDPYVGRGAEVGATQAPGDFLNDAQGANVDAQGPAPPNFGGGPPVIGQGGTNVPGGGVPGQGGGGPGGGGGSGPGAGGFGGDWAARMAAHSGGFGQASNASLMPAGYQPRNSMSDASFQEALSKYGIGQDILSQEHGAGRMNMIDALMDQRRASGQEAMSAGDAMLLNSAMAQRNAAARRGVPDQNAHGVVSGADSRSAFNDSQVDAAARGYSGTGLPNPNGNTPDGSVPQTVGGNVPLAHRPKPTQAAPPNRRTRTV